MGQESYPEVARLKQVKGVGTLITFDLCADAGRCASFWQEPG